MYRCRFYLTLLCCMALPVLAGCNTINRAMQPTPEEVEAASGGGPEIDTVELSMLKAAKAAEQSGDYSKAMGLYEQLVTQFKDVPEYQISLAENVRKLGDMERAHKVYKLLYEQHPDNIDIKEGYGLTRLARGQVKEAAALLKEVMDEDNSRWRSVNGLGIAYSMQQQFDDALRQYRAALKLSSKNPSILNNIGMTLAIKGDYEKANTALELAARHLPSSSEQLRQVKLNEALVYGLAGDMKRAEETAKPYLTGPELYNNLGFYAYLAENAELARTYLNMALTGSTQHYDRAWKNLQQVGR